MSANTNAVQNIEDIKVYVENDLIYKILSLTFRYRQIVQLKYVIDEQGIESISGHQTEHDGQELLKFVKIRYTIQYVLELVARIEEYIDNVNQVEESIKDVLRTFITESKDIMFRFEEKFKFIEHDIENSRQFVKIQDILGIDSTQEYLIKFMKFTKECDRDQTHRRQHRFQSIQQYMRGAVRSHVCEFYQVYENTNMKDKICWWDEHSAFHSAGISIMEPVLATYRDWSMNPKSFNTYVLNNEVLEPYYQELKNIETYCNEELKKISLRDKSNTIFINIDCNDLSTCNYSEKMPSKNPRYPW